MSEMKNACGFNRRQFLALSALATTSFMLPGLVEAGTPAPKISLAGDLRKAFNDFLAYERGESATHANYRGHVTIAGCSYHISIDTRTCARAGYSKMMMVDAQAPYFNDLLDVAYRVPESSISVTPERKLV